AVEDAARRTQRRRPRHREHDLSLRVGLGAHAEGLGKRHQPAQRARGLLISHAAYFELGGTMTNIDRIAELRRLGQSVWLDHLDRQMIRSGQLARYRDRGVAGVTVNPTIFARALESSDVYADDVMRRHDRGQDAEAIVWDLLVEDVQAAADVLRPVYEREHGGGGVVSIEGIHAGAKGPERPNADGPARLSPCA